MYSPRKVQQQLQLLGSYVYAGFQTVGPLALWHDQRADHKPVPADDEAWQPIAIGGDWSGRDEYYWLRFDLAVPALGSADQYVVHLNLGRSGGDNNSGFEGLVYVDGQPFQAVDSKHEDMYLNADFANKTLAVRIMMWTGLEGGGPHVTHHYVLKTVEAGVLPQTIRKAWRYLCVMAETAQELGEDEPLKYAYQNFLDQSLKQFRFGAMTTAEISDTAATVQQQIDAFIAQHAGEKKAFQISAVGQTHIDVAWLWRLRHTREKTARTFSTVLQLMKQYPDFQFMHSTPQEYEYVKEDYPALFAQVQKRAQEGRWEADGGTWLEPDANMPSGEALTRQFLYGSRFFAKEFGAKQTVLWLPDVFGYSWALPQIMLGFGIHDFMTTKISWNDTNRMPHDTFAWRGIDGSVVLTHFITTVEKTSNYYDKRQWGYTYNGEITPHTVLGSYHVYADKNLNHDLLLAYGFGDGGGGPQREMIENIHIINQLPGMPTVKNTRVDDYFKRLRANIAASGQQLPEWNGELYLEFHRGTYTSQALVKKQNRQLEFALRNLEIRLVQAKLAGNHDYPKATLDQLWTTLLRNQFHDILPGSAIHEVYQDHAKEFAASFATIKKLNTELDAKVTKPQPDTYTVWNPNAFAKQFVITFAEKRPGSFALADGTALLAQATADGYQVSVPCQPLTTTVVQFTAQSKTENAPAPAAKVQAGTAETEHYRIAWNAGGHLTSIFDKDNQREVLNKNGLGNVLTVYEDRPLVYDNWNIDKDYPEKPTVLEATAITQSALGPVGQQIHFEYKFQHSTIDQTLTLYQNDRRIDFATHADWQDSHFLLRTGFEVDVLSDHAQFDVQYGNVSRPTTQNTSWEWAKFETMAHKWADLSQRDYGVALMNDCKYGYSVHGKLLTMSLLRAGTYPDTTADIGSHDFVYSLLPHRGDFAEGQVEEAAMALNNQPRVWNGAGQVPALFSFDSDLPVMVDAIKHSEDGNAVILRLHEYTGQNQQLRVRPQFDFESAALVRLDETQPKALSADAGGALTLSLRPYQVVTIALKLKD